MAYEWDKNKAKLNDEKHGVSFDEAATVFDDPFFLVFPDPMHSVDEIRYLIMGESSALRMLLVVYTERQDEVRIISAREAIAKEVKLYEKEKFKSLE
jgi:uncharacterized DUF497 family protein